MNTARHETGGRPLTLGDIFKKIEEYRMHHGGGLVSRNTIFKFSDLVDRITHGQDGLKGITLITPVTPTNKANVEKGVRLFLAGKVLVPNYDLDNAMNIVMPRKHPYM